MNATAALRRFIQRQWLEGGWLTTVLSPLAALVALAVRRKRATYTSGRKTAWRAPIPVAVIGNLYVGGTGKTPVVIAIVEGLRARGWTPAVVSRGYGVRIHGRPRVGQGRLAPADFGDEPALIAAATGVPVAVHGNRAAAAQALLQAHPEVDVIIADDGLQHLALARDIEIVVQDERGLGNGRLLPAGPLREPPERLTQVDAIITNLPTPKKHHALPTRAPSGPRQLTMHLVPMTAQRLSDGTRQPLTAFVDQAVAAAAGIGNPQRFFQTLKAAGIDASPCLALPDHYAFKASPFTRLATNTILVTTKDAVKCQALNDPRIWAVHVQASFSDPDFLDWLSVQLRQRHLR